MQEIVWRHTNTDSFPSRVSIHSFQIYANKTQERERRPRNDTELGLPNSVAPTTAHRVGL